jgi:alkanesulfonate monooxygenase SsuD/methylene tetrahydromethanopterin reductase-like flavin-dependent oxidoreductase (luciferase family)
MCRHTQVVPMGQRLRVSFGAISNPFTPRCNTSTTRSAGSPREGDAWRSHAAARPPTGPAWPPATGGANDRRTRLRLISATIRLSVPVEFGISFAPTWSDPAAILRLTQAADQAGFDLIGIQDHPYQWRFFDTWTLIAFLAARTERVRFFPDVANLPLRPPAMLAKAAASLDVLTGGRVELGLGAGAFWDAVAAMGGPRRTKPEAVEAFREAVEIIRLVWSGERGVRFEGEHHRVAGLHTGPRPAHDMGIWVGAGGPRMLRLIGEKCDGWVPSSGWAGRELLKDGLAIVEGAAREAGRDPASIRRVYNVMGMIQPERGRDFEGPASYWVEELSSLATDVGMDAFIFWPAQDEMAQVELFASEVAPAVRQARA